MLRVGLTGGIGSGKSTVAELFAAHGVPVLDADRIARDLVAPGSPAWHAIVGHFGADILKEGSLDRARLRQLVFADPDQKRWLEGLLHPLVYAEMARRIGELSAPYCILVIPLLLETGRRDFVDRLLVIDCPESLQRLRVRDRDRLDPAEIDRILASQANRTERLAAADDVLENTGGREELRRAVARLHRHYLALGGGTRQPPGPAPRTID